MIHLEHSIKIVLIEFTLIALLNILLMLISNFISARLKDYSKPFENLQWLFVFIINGYAILWKMNYSLGIIYKVLLFIFVVIFNLSPTTSKENLIKLKKTINAFSDKDYAIISQLTLFYLAAILSVSFSLYAGNQVEYEDQRRFIDLLAFGLLFSLCKYIFKARTDTP